MLYEAEHAPADKKILFQFAKQYRKSRKTPIPKSLAPGPSLAPGLSIFYLAFWDLITERAQPNAPIPWSAMHRWARAHRLDGDATERLEFLVREMDLAFLNWKEQIRARSKTDRKGPRANGDSRTVRTKHAAVLGQRGT